MALRPEFVAAHIQRWEATLPSNYYPHRRSWPSRIFHHAPVENAVEILRSGCLRSRNDPENAHPKDIASPQVVSTRVEAHEFVRMYFRPKNPTQYSIEGIRKPGECPFGDATQCPVLIILAMDAQTILTRHDIMFSKQNMQINGTDAGDSEEFFSTIPFDKVYHEGYYTQAEGDIKAHRCAEVLASSPLYLGDCLKEIFVRSDPERDTLLHLLGEYRELWADRCFVSEGLKVFEKRHTFVREIGLSPEGVYFEFHPRFDRRPLSVRVHVWDAAGTKVIDFYNDALDAKPPNAGRWIFQRPLPNGHYKVRAELEGCMAFENDVVLGDSLF